MDIKIPKSITLAAEVIPIEVVGTIDHDPTVEGLAILSGTPKIYISTFAEGTHREYVFFHEFVHHVLATAGEEKLCADEIFVSRFASLLHQGVVTADAKTTDIPSFFCLGGTKYSVEKVEEVEDEGDCEGLARYCDSKIELKASNKKDFAVWVYYHELVHCILFAMSDDKRRTDEDLVSRLATFIHQGLKGLN